ncbi:hypothetical protein [Pseudactinotalea sp.]|uniref:hypothetical protein n=1 Tax=Pseudactinotalea sp. TaxID=1926260 RepID=UPI003B3AFE82
MTTLAPPPAVTAYANAVRDHLAGLDAETLDELTGGLEADLAEALSERLPDDGAAPDLAAVTSVFGSPGLYADELRSAAGVELPPEPGARTRPRLRDVVGRARVDAVTTWAALRERHGWLRWGTDFLVSLRPAWWLLRAWVLFHLFTGLRNPFFGSGADKLLLLGLVVVSVLWGQKRIGQRRWWRRLGLLATTLAIVATLPILIGAYNRTVYSGWSDGAYNQGFSDGQSVAMQHGGLSGELTNLFVYGADGQPVVNAQIVDQHGNPVVLNSPSTGRPWAEWSGWEWGGEAVPVPVLEDTPLNVYPWSYLRGEDVTIRDNGSAFGSSSLAVDPRWPAATLFPIPGYGTEDPTDREPSDPGTDEASGSDDAEADGGEPGDSEATGGEAGADEDSEATDSPSGDTEGGTAE